MLFTKKPKSEVPANPAGELPDGKQPTERTPATVTRVESLLEFSTSEGLRPRIDAIRGVLFGVKVLGLTSRNGRQYRTSCIANAAPLYEGIKVNVNHARGTQRSPRDYQDRLGCLREVRADDDGLFADLHFNPRHSLAQQLLWDAEHAPENVGLSHNVEAKTSRDGSQVVVEEIMRVNCVDLVADPATTAGLFESRDAISAVNFDWQQFEETFAELRRRRPDLFLPASAAAVAEMTDFSPSAESAEFARILESVDVETAAFSQDIKAAATSDTCQPGSWTLWRLMSSAIELAYPSSPIDSTVCRSSPLS